MRLQSLDFFPNIFETRAKTYRMAIENFAKHFLKKFHTKIINAVYIHSMDAGMNFNDNTIVTEKKNWTKPSGH